MSPSSGSSMPVSRPQPSSASSSSASSTSSSSPSGPSGWSRFTGGVKKHSGAAAGFIGGMFASAGRGTARASRGAMNVAQRYSIGKEIKFVIFFAVALLVHFIDMRLVQTYSIWAVQRIFIHFAMALFALYMFMPEGATFGGWMRENIKFYFIYALFAIIFPLICDQIPRIAGQAGANDSMVVFLVLFNVFLTPLWAYYAVFQTKMKTRLGGIIAFLALIIWLVWMMSQLYNMGITEQYKVTISSEQKMQAMQFGTATWNTLKNAVPNTLDFIKTSLAGPLIKYAVGEDIYASQVDQNKNEPLGVYLDNLQAASQSFYIDEPVTAWATLKARTLDEDKEIKIKVSCEADWGCMDTLFSKPKMIAGDVNPNSNKTDLEMEIYQSEHKDITCSIPENSLMPGYRSVKFKALFDFTTMAYQKGYFMEKDRHRAMIREKVDPYTEFGITDKNPITVHSNGPIAIGMKIDQPLIGLDKDSFFTLRVSLNNRWQGKIKKLKKVVLKIPDSMDLFECKPVSFTKRECKGDECEEGKYKFVYEAIDFGQRQFTDVKQIMSFSCRVKVNDLARALGNTPVITKYFKATADYEYELTKSIGANLQVVPGMTVPVCPTTASLTGGTMATTAATALPGHVPNYPLAVPTDKNSLCSAAVANAVAWNHNAAPPKESPTFEKGVILFTSYYTLNCNDAKYTGWKTDNAAWKKLYADWKMEGSMSCEGKSYSWWTNYYDKKWVSETKTGFIGDPMANKVRAGTSCGTDALPFRTIAVNPDKGTQCYIPYGSKVYIDYGAGNPLTGWYVAEDTGDAFHGQCKIDIYAGVGSAEYKKFGDYKKNNMRGGAVYVYPPLSTK